VERTFPIIKPEVKMETKIPQTSLHQNIPHQAVPAVQANPRHGGPVDSFRPTQGTTAEAQVFDPNPVVTLKDSTLKDRDDAKDAVPESAYFKVTLNNLLPGDSLDGKYVTTQKTKDRACDPERRFIYDRSDSRFNEVMAYYHMDTSQMHIQSLGFNNVNNRQVFVDAHGTTDDNSFYVPWENTITFGTGGVDDAEDADIILHEYGHSIVHSQIPGFSSAGESRCVGEGFADYWSTTASARKSDGFDKEVIGNWDATSYSTANPPNLRRIDSPLTYEDKNGDFYHDGTIWATTLWDIYNTLGKETTDKIVLESHFFLSTTATMQDAARALVEADKKVFQGANSDTIISTLIKRKFFASPDQIGASGSNADAGQDAFFVTGPARPENISDQYLHGKILKNDCDIRLSRSQEGLGGHYLHYQQYYRGIPVEEAEISVAVDRKDRAPSIFNDTTVAEKGFKSLPAGAQTDEGKAVSAAIDCLPCRDISPEGKASLVYHKTSDGGESVYTLAWKVDVRSAEPPGDWSVYVSAVDGSIMSSRNNIWVD